VTCIFCEIVAETAPAYMIYQDGGACAFLDIAPLADGHTLVVPRRHVVDIAEPGAAAAVADLAPALEFAGRTLMDRLGADGITVFQANREAGGQDVFHLHFHLLPRRTGDPRLVQWRRNAEAVDRLGETHRRLVENS
jgi:histidine triad (HIT) family protein